jgi:MFS family permease
MTAQELRRARVAVFAYFFVLGVASATWAARLPAIKADLHLSDARLGLVLFAVPAGAVLTLPVSGRIADRFGAVRVTRIAGVVTPAALILIGLGPQTGSLTVLVAALACYGATAGLLDVAMNACGATLELAYGRPILSSLHAGYSIAGLAGAGIGALSAALGIGPLPTFAATAVALIVGGLFAGPRMVIPPAPPQARPPEDAPRRLPSQIVVVIWVLGLLALCGQLGEGAAGDWSAVYLHVDLGTSAAVAAAGLAAFSVTMAAGRMVGDRLAARFGSVRLVRGSGLVAGLGLAAGLLIGTPAAAVAGFALLGAGLAGIFPQIVSSAVRLDPSRAGRNIGRIAAVAYSGLLVGPVAVGAAASGVGLRDALLIPAGLAVLVAAAAGVLSPHETPRDRQARRG